MIDLLIDSKVVCDSTVIIGGLELPDGITQEEFDREYSLIVENFSSHLKSIGIDLIPEEGCFSETGFIHHASESMDNDYENIVNRTIVLSAGDEKLFSQEILARIKEFISSLELDYTVVIRNDLDSLTNEFGDDYFQVLIVIRKDGIFGDNGGEVELHPFMKKIGFVMPPEAREFILNTKNELSRLGLGQG
jgi:hypothetical protein